MPIEQIDKEKKKVFLIGHKQNDSRLSMTNSIRELQLHSDSPLVPVKGWKQIPIQQWTMGLEKLLYRQNSKLKATDKKQCHKPDYQTFEQKNPKENIKGFEFLWNT